MNRKNASLNPSVIIALFILLILLLFCHQTVQAAETPQRGQTKSLTIAVASDLHLNPENNYGVVVNPLVYYNMEITDALFYDAIRQKADILLLTGDLTEAGGEKAHRTLVQKLRKAKAAGLRTYVLPGNHDLTKGEAEQFSELYKEFGYADACSRDTDSLSYSLLPNGDAAGSLMLLMLDTDGYTMRTNGAYVSDITLEWIEEQLKQAQKKQLQVLGAGHYSLLTGQTTEFTGDKELTALLKKYQVPLYLCGHLHGRKVSSDQNLTELVTEQLTAYPCSYALLNAEGDNAYRYNPRRIDVSSWARETGQTSPDLLDFDTYAENVFLERSEETIRLLKSKQYLSRRKTKQAIEFFRQVQKEHLQGTLPAHKKEILKSPGYKAFMKIAEGTTYGRWIPEYIESASPYTGGFQLRGYQLSQ